MQRAHLEQGAVLGSRVGRPYLEFAGLAYQAPVELERSFSRAAELGRQAVELAERHGWTEKPAAGSAYIALAGALIRQGRPEEAGPWVQRAERAVESRSRARDGNRGCSPFAGCSNWRAAAVADALAAFGCERLAGRLATPQELFRPVGAGIGWCTPWCAWAKRSAPSRPWRTSVTRTETAARSASPKRCCGWPRTSRAPRPPRSPRFWTAPLPWCGRTG